MLRAHGLAIGYSLDELKGISPALCMHKINLGEDANLVVDYQHHLHQKMKEVVRQEVIKITEAGIIYIIADSKWVSHVHCVPKRVGSLWFQMIKMNFWPSVLLLIIECALILER
jgi:hypothetical protein